MRRAIDRAFLDRLRLMPAEDALALLATYLKRDPTFRPVKNAATRRWHALTDCGHFEILTTGVKWWDMRAKKGGGGAIDLAMHVEGISFVEAVERLRLRMLEHG